MKRRNFILACLLLLALPLSAAKVDTLMVKQTDNATASNSLLVNDLYFSLGVI